MKNSDMPAMPTRDFVEDCGVDGSSGPRLLEINTGGLSKREAFAMAAMQGDFAAQSPEHGEMISEADCAYRAPIWIAAAEALLAELEKSS